MDKIKQRVIQDSNDILEYLLDFKKANPDFTFSLRKRDSPQSTEARLVNGQWFQGSNYIYVPLFKRGDGTRKIKTLGFVIIYNDKGTIEGNYLEISFKGGINDPAEIDFHENLAKQLGLTLERNNHGKLDYPNPNDYKKNLQDYLTRVRPIALEGLKERNLMNSYVISESEFQKDLQRIEAIKSMKKERKSGLSAQNVGIPLNQIFYGPPGTGKTYNTRNMALKILGVELEGKKRDEIRSIYEEKVKLGQIVFTTFHQSLSYEDFIEGIKPEEPKTEGGNVSYKVKDGIFKQLANEASRTKSRTVTIENQKQSLTKELFEDFYNQFVETLLDAEGDKSNCILKTSEGYEFGLFRNSANSITVKAGLKKTKMSASLVQLTKVIFEEKAPTYKSYENIIIQKILEDKGYEEAKSDNSDKNFVLIIDEINRGNVSQIFGELITLIEEDKRLGGDEALTVTLPYSQPAFGVPSNLYIIGTMNTADRSVEALDSALRRRFSFIEMAPKPEMLSPQQQIWDLWWKYYNVEWDDKKFVPIENKLYEFLGITFTQEQKDDLWTEMIKTGKKSFELDFPSDSDFKGINLEILLKTINARIERLIGSDHQIGHSYFIGVSSLDDLMLVFKNKIIPLLQEYFFGDYGKIGLVLGKGFIRLKEEQPKDKFTFADFNYSDSDSFLEKEIFEIVDYSDTDSIYTLETSKNVKIEMDFEKAIRLLINNRID